MYLLFNLASGSENKRYRLYIKEYDFVKLKTSFMKTFNIFCLGLLFPLFAFGIGTGKASSDCLEMNDEKPQAACSITGVEIIERYCLEDGIEGYYFSITGTDFGINGYTVTNSIDNEVFNFNFLSGYFMLPTYCNGEVFVTFTDNDNPACNITISLGELCCECLIDVEIMQSNCNSFNINSAISISSYGSCIYFNPTITVNNVEYSYTHVNNVYTINNIVSYEPELVYRICYDVPNLSVQCETIILPNPCYPPITNFQVLQDSSVCQGDSMLVTFSFDGPYFGAYGFTVSSVTGGNQTYNIGDPYVYKLPADCYEPVIISIFDNNHPSITVWDTIGPICCPCMLNRTYDLSTCQDATFDVELTINELHGSCLDNELILILGNDTLEYNDTLGLLQVLNLSSPDSLLYFRLLSANMQDTIIYLDTLQNPCFQPNVIPCQITQFNVTSDSSICQGGFMTLGFNFNATNFGLSGYNISSSTGYNQNFLSSDTKLVELFAECDGAVSFTIKDLQDTLCTATDTFGVICCPCVPVFNVTTSGCDNDRFDMNIDVNILNGSCIEYPWQLFINGQLTNFQIINNDYVVFDIQSADSLLFYTLCSQVPELLECFSDTLVNPCYQSPPPPTPCSISSFTVTVDTLACHGEVIDVLFDFTATSFGAQGYTLTDNKGVQQTFAVNDSRTLTIFPDCVHQYIFTITDNVDSLCTANATVGNICCPCTADFTFSQGPCTDGTSTAIITTDSIEGSCVNYDWSLFVNSIPYTLNSQTTGWSVNNIQSTDSLLVYDLCSLVPGLTDCYQVTTLNPCFVSTVGTEGFENFDKIRYQVLDNGMLILDNQSLFSTEFAIYNISGIQMNQPQILQTQQSATIKSNQWPTGIYMLRLVQQGKSVTKKILIFDN